MREDLKQPLEAYRPELAGLMFQTKLGSMLDKSERMLTLADAVAGMLGLDEAQRATAHRATFLAKADLATKMVTEMTSLQGIIGRRVCTALRRRRGSRAGHPRAIPDGPGEHRSAWCWRWRTGWIRWPGCSPPGWRPRARKTRSGCRRAAIGVVQPLIEHHLEFDLNAAVAQAAKLEPVKADGKVQAQVLEFLAGRLSVLLKERGQKYDVVDAVLAAQANDPAGASRAVTELQGWVERPDWGTILPAFARCVRITRDQKRVFQVDEQAFQEPEEEKLYAALQKAEDSLKAEEAASGSAEASGKMPRASIDNFLNAFVPMIPAINAFFDKVLVMAEDRQARENRLALLQRIAAMQQGIVDLSRLEGF